ncbi:hypothetical protein [Macrococcoides caseolyticum]|uniref:hypothetical protein n=1 Tax=Macrococcoides TaxID=3076173 RepID=UPI000C329849|nr:hypothetical protein [Macrococcus caseolyticus]PKD97937.1 hypothetical protein CW719_09635 [Macrococcus caseolyticus]PKE47178.1 hypothetical protein CW677_09105 [Macrococcus caseolyticus]PKE67107.1 hypothetical protein CW663_09680 [Macrococcus caseolyticus]PKF13952.1 hypothetical protein CW690_09100 [Macrococcus caseolyticus]PKF18392.1 hypothetical protein CW717_09635 [Macrococcus caseolyticus]
MSLLDDLKNNKEHLRENPLANREMQIKKIAATSIKVTGNTHAKLTALDQIYVDMNKAELVDFALSKLADKLKGEDKETYEKVYENSIDQKIDLARRKGLF